jgi:hypothetical protein
VGQGEGAVPIMLNHLNPARGLAEPDSMKRLIAEAGAR